MTRSGYAPSSSTSPRRVLGAVLALLALAVVAVAVAVVAWSGASLRTDPSALARIELQPFSGKLVSATASAPDGRAVTLERNGRRLTPTTLLTPGETVRVDVVVRRPGWIAWALGKERRERLTVTAPVAHVTDRWLTGHGDSVRVRFDAPVAGVEYRGKRHPASGPTVAVPTSAPAGSLGVAAAPRTWERVGDPARISWFPPAHTPVALVTPAPSQQISPASDLRLTLSEPIRDALGSATPKLQPAAAGSWKRLDSHTLVFHPRGLSLPMGQSLRVVLPKPLAVASATGRGVHQTSVIDWQVGAPSVLRLHQLLAELGYLPVNWAPHGSDVALDEQAQAEAAVDPPAGSFDWRYGNTPNELTRQWKPDARNEITRGAIMMFQDTHHLAVDSFAGPAVWKALLADLMAHKRRDAGYSYVYVHRKVPQKLTLWHNGHVVLTSPGNTGVPAAPTKLGTFPVFEHIPVGTMSGTNPNGSHYRDPGIKWISYFSGGEALHAFPRASFGTPQSLGCVELPEASAKKVWPYTPIGALVTIED
ncbi:MAG TPA: L,D-transpeptidase [Thermoleophilaceae bacterium]|nr:L,D-transpeptidase [Thermoleophilaceae bacterium]